MGLNEVLQAHPEIPVSPSLNYPGKPIILGPAKEIMASGLLTFSDRGVARMQIGGRKIAVLKRDQVDNVCSAMNTLLRNLQPGSEFEALVNQENEVYEQAKEKKPRKGGLEYGVVVYHPFYKALYWEAPRDIHRLATLARVQDMIRDRGLRLSYAEIRRLFNQIVLGAAGASVASNGVHRDRDTVFGRATKVGDFDPFDYAVRSRRRFGIRDFQGNKAVVTAREINEADPWLPVYVYPDGLHIDNYERFFNGDINTGEPKLTDFLEAIDHPERKVQLAKVARDMGVRSWRVTDLAGAWLVEYLPHHIYKDFPLGITVEDKALFTALDNYLKQPSTENFFAFATAFIGDAQWQVPEFREFLLKRGTTPFVKGIPQLGIASEGAASQFAYSQAAVELGWEIPNRYFYDARAQTMITDTLSKSSSGHWIDSRKVVNNTEGFSIDAVIDLTTHKCHEFLMIDKNTGQSFYVNFKVSRDAGMLTSANLFDGTSSHTRVKGYT